MFSYIDNKYVKDFAYFITTMVHAKIVDKNKSWIMKIVAWFLSFFKIMDKKTFMNNYATAFFKRIWLPFEVGNLKDRNFFSQIVLISHECQHIHQQRLGGFMFYLKYLFSPSSRAEYEIEANITKIEVYHWLTGRIISTKKLSEKLVNYKCENYVGYAKRKLDAAVEEIKRGNKQTTIGRCAVLWMNIQRQVRNQSQ